MNNINPINTINPINPINTINTINPINPINPINTINPINSMDNLLLLSSNYINHLNNGTLYLNNLIYMFNNNNTNNNNNNTNNNNNNNNNNNTNNNTNNNNNNTNNTSNQRFAYLLDYNLGDFERLSNTNLYDLIKANSADLYYGNIENPKNETCAITHETFSNCDQVTMLKECGHIFNCCAIKKWLIDHQTCPNCRYNILTNSNIISYSNPDNNKQIFLYSNEFKFYLALHIDNLLANRRTNNENENENENENNEYDIGLLIV
jgi:hypothetical protein